MARTTPELVEAIIEVDSTVDLQPFIDSATEIVTECCGAAGYSATYIRDIETWVAAHFYCARDPRTTLEHAGEVREFYENKVGFGFKNSRYGQRALLMDYAGGLAALDNALAKVTKKLDAGAKKNILWLGTDRC